MVPVGKAREVIVWSFLFHCHFLLFYCIWHLLKLITTCRLSLEERYLCFKLNSSEPCSPPPTTRSAPSSKPLRRFTTPVTKTHTIAMSYLSSSNLTPAVFVKPSPSSNLPAKSRVSSPPTSTTAKPPLTSVSASSSPSSARATYTRHSPASSPSSPSMGCRFPRPSATTPTTSSSNLTARRTPSCSPTSTSSTTVSPNLRAHHGRCHGATEGGRFLSCDAELD
ncbi:uncharacterized protein HKW66_Vig0171910 [Vigna angularis]|uniref:Uncharacterized protein n=1 Tax=Phaseolus angularis TaxID=3914 RepID=A0A8T0JQF5_PHAAN|nr:uncharacterized protein HKW66_Vig0171910 [Vigna angularis]